VVVALAADGAAPGGHVSSELESTYFVWGDFLTQRIILIARGERNMERRHPGRRFASILLASSVRF